MILASVDPSPAAAKRRRPVWLPTLAALFFALLTAWLGQWQLDRAEEKRARQAALDAAARLPVVDLNAGAADWPTLTHRRARVTGRFAARHQIYLDNRIHQGQPGYHALAPLVFDGRAVLVNRGWLAAAAERSTPPLAPPPAGLVTVEGVLLPARARYLELSGAAVPGPVWQNLDLERYRAGFGAGLPELLIQQTGPAGDGLVRDWPRPDAGVERHLGYAAQWFALTAAIIALYLYYGVWRPRHAAG